MAAVRPRRHGMLGEIVDLRRWLRADRERAWPERLARDRSIGRTLDAAGSGRADPVARVLGWWSRVREVPAETSAARDASAGPAPVGARLEAWRRLATLALVALGVLSGLLVAGVAFAYDGRSPVNLFALLGVLVGLPTLLLVLTLLTLLGAIPGLGGLQGTLSGMSPGRWAGSWLDRVLDLDLFAPRDRMAAARGPAAAAFARWQLVVFSQWLALGFFAAVLLVAAGLIAFTDLAFGWSTTLRFDAAALEPWVDALAAPWASWWPAAAPDPALLETSRFYRLESPVAGAGRAAALGGWWPFVLMTILVYGLLPRLLLLVFAAWRLHRATRGLLLEDPEVSALLDRLEAPVLALGDGADPDAADTLPVSLPAWRRDPDRGAGGARGPRAGLVTWNGAAAPEVAAQWVRDCLGVATGPALELGVLQSAAVQRERLAELPDDLARLVIVTKGWEPPLLEFADFLATVREQVGPGCSITLVPLDLDLRGVRADQRDVWARALARTGDARLYVQEALP